MNLLGSSYLAATRYADAHHLRHMQNQERLTRQFQSEWEHYDGIDDRQLLSALLYFACNNVPYYREYFANRSNRDPSQLTDWPVLPRQVLRDRFDQLLSPVAETTRTWTHASGGSTGQPVAVVHDEHFAAKAQALRNLCAKLFFEGPYYNKLILWGMNQEIERQKNNQSSLKARVKGSLLQLGGLKTSHINTFEFSEKKFQECIDILKHQKPNFIFGYAGSVYQLARYMDEHNLKPSSPMNKIATTAQTLYPFMREKIEKVFDCTVCDHYGSREVGPIAWQHPDGDMYFPKFFSVIETVNDQGDPCAKGDSGRILVTDLHNFSMPLIRYEVGDMGVRGEDAYFQGYPFSVLTEITGRASDEFVKKDGTLVHSQFFTTLFYFRPWIDEFCVVQKERELVEVLYKLRAPDVSPPDTDIKEIEDGIRGALDPSCQIAWRQVDQIPTTKAGKRLFVRSEVNKEHLSAIH